MKINKPALILFAILLLVIGLGYYFWPKPSAVIVPAKSGTFKPIVNPEPLATAAPQIIYIKGQRVEVPAAVNMDLFQTMVEAIERAKTAQDSAAYYKAITDQLQITADLAAVRKYSNTFENGKIKITVNTETEGKLKSILPKWETKPDTVRAILNRSLYGGLEAGINTRGLQPTAKGIIMYGDKSGNVFSGGYDTNGTAWGGYFRKFDF